ncbi:NADPH-dependent ferric siderophore reductase [Enterobacterales bacterium CwR94]|nr:NADPH-dependent ferric siderophore reductase [Enterobacterales bacterium CwR94]
MSAVRSYRLFNVTLARKEVISSSMLSCVFQGEEIKKMKMDAPDQRIKLLFPSEDGTPSAMSEEGEGLWYERILKMPKEKRPQSRTYTLRSLDVDNAQMTVEFVMHGTEGPASAWALLSEPGAALQMVAPNADFAADSGGYEWMPSSSTEQALLVADETALPAARGILETLAQQANPPRTQVFLEVPKAADCVDLSEFTFAEIHWLPREGRDVKYGECLLEGVRNHIALPQGDAACAIELEEEAEGQLLWDRAKEGASCRFYGWVAAESSAVKHLRRYLIGECCIPRECVNFMAYWSQGKHH